MPILRMRTSTLVSISSDGADPTSAFTRLLEAKIFRVVPISFTCKRCQADGVTNVCVHFADKVPPWLEGDDNLGRSIFGEDVNMQRENLGITQTNGPQCFSKLKVDCMLALPPVQITRPAFFVFVSADPVAGSDNVKTASSEFCIISACRPGFTIIGIDAFDVIVRDDYEGRLRAHLFAIRAHPMLGGATIVLDAEAGTGLEAGNIQKIAAEFENVIMMNSGKRVPGTRTTNSSKMKMMQMMREHLDAGNIQIMKDFITSSNDRPKLLRSVRDQLVQYERVVIPTKSLTHKSIIVCSGKRNGLDDIAVTMQRNLFAMYEFESNDMYRRFRSR